MLESPICLPISGLVPYPLSVISGHPHCFVLACQNYANLQKSSGHLSASASLISEPHPWTPPTSLLSTYTLATPSTSSMSSTVVLSQLRGLTEKAEKLKGKLDKISPTDDQWNSLIDSSLHLANAASQLQEKMETLRNSRTKRAWKESEKHRSQARSLSGELFTTGRLKQSAVFRRNIVVIFEGPKTSTFDSDDAKVRKESTRKRCDVIRNLSPDGIVSWAIAYAPTLWAGGAMASDVFDCLTSDIEPDVVQTWPTVIRETLHKLKDDEAYLRSSLEYGKFLQG